MPYTASRPSLTGNVGGSAPPQPSQIDVGGAIEALTGGATSLIHATMLRKQAQNAVATQRQELALRQQSEKFQQDRMLSDERYREGQATNERQKTEDAFTLAGGVRGKPGQSTMLPDASMESVGPLPSPVQPRGPIARTMARGMAPVQKEAGVPITPLAGPGYTPQAAPAPAASNPLPANAKLRKGLTAPTPDTVDLDRNVKYQTSQGAANTRADASRDVALINQEGRLTVAGMNAASKTAHDNASIHIAGIKAGSAANKPMTPSQRVAAQRFVFDQIGKQSNGNPDDAAGILNGGDGALAKLAGEVGITEPEVRRAAAAFGTKAGQATDKEILGVFQSGMAKDIPAAKAAVEGAKTAPVKPGIRPAAVPTDVPNAPAKSAKPTDIPNAPTKLQPLTEAAKTKAKTEPEFAAFLTEKGYTDADWGAAPMASMKKITRLVKRVPADSGKK